MLSQLAEKALALPIKQSLISYCPSMDLVAVVLQDDQVQVFRLNGQNVFGVPRRQDGANVTALCWKPNGRTLAIAYSTSTVVLVSAHSGKVLSQTSCAARSNQAICCLSWGLSFIDAQAAQALLDGQNGSSQKRTSSTESLLDEALTKGLRDLDIEFPLDLPADLASIDVETSLPKLSTLPAGGKNNDVFSARASLDALFHISKKDSSDSVDTLLAGFEDGAIHLSIYDSFEIGTFTDVTGSKDHRVVRHRSHPYTSTHACLVADRTARPRSLSLVPMDLKMIADTGRYLPLLASKSTQLQNLIRYMKQVVSQISEDFHTSQTLPQRFMKNANEDLEEKEQTNLANAAFHLVGTGQCSPVLKEWLTDQLGDRGYRRWEKAATSGYEGVCRYTLQNLLPALDRFAITLSRFRGLSRFYDSSMAHGLDTPELERIFDTLSCLRVTAHHILGIAGRELRSFTAFSKWLKLEIEVQSTEPTSASVDEFPGSYSALEYPQILDFIQGPMQQSELEQFCGEADKSTNGQSWVTDLSSLIYENFKKVLATKKNDGKLPSLASLTSRLEELASGMFQGIAQAQKRKVMFGRSIPIEEENVDSYDMVVTFNGFDTSGSGCDIFVAAAAASRAKVTLHKVTLQIINGMSTVQASELAQVRLPSGFGVQDLKFADEQILVAALSSLDKSEQPLLVYLPYRPTEEGGALAYSASREDQAKTTLDLSERRELEGYVKHRFDEKPEWLPGTLEVNGRKDRRVLCVADKDGLRYKVFDLDSAAARDKEEEEEDGEEEMEVE